MSQHDMNVANASGATVRGDLNNALVALATLSSGATEPSTTFSYQWWADTTAGLLKQRNAANNGWEVRGTLAETLGASRSSDTILAAADHGKSFVATANFTQTLTAVATLGDGWFCHYRVNSGAVVTLDPNSTEQIDGAATKVVTGPASGLIFCTGAAFLTYGFDQPAAADAVAGVIETATQAEQETGSSVAVAVTPGRQHLHPSAAKAWVMADNAGGVTVSYNVSGVGDNGTGDIGINWGTDFSAATYCVVATAKVDFGGALSNSYAMSIQNTSFSAGGARLYNVRLSDAATVDPNHWMAAAFGDHA